MATDSNKTAIGVGVGVALLGGLFAAFGGAKKKPSNAPLAGVPKKSCNCGR
jgi:hypothetical protein